MAVFCLPAAANCPRFKGDHRGTSYDGSTICFSYQGESCLKCGGGAPNSLDSEDQDILMNHIRPGTRGTYGSDWCWFHSFCKGHNVNAELVLLAFIVKFTCQITKTGVVHVFRIILSFL